MANLIFAGLVFWVVAVVAKLGKKLITTEERKSETSELIRLNVDNALLKAQVKQLERELAEERQRST